MPNVQSEGLEPNRGDKCNPAETVPSARQEVVKYQHDWLSNSGRGAMSGTRSRLGGVGCRKFGTSDWLSIRPLTQFQMFH